VRVGEFLARPAGRLMPAGTAGRQAGPARAAADVKEAVPSRVSPEPVSPVPEPPLHELLLASVPVMVLRSSRERLLGPVLEYDTRHNAELLPTLRSFLACDGSWSACAARMYVHVNTVRYRISRIEALTGRDLSALADRVDFFLALRG
jgi:DNA-binding PucR family transcriptional regulator